MNTADFLANLLTGVIIIGYPFVLLVLFASPFWITKYLLKRKLTPLSVIVGIVVGLLLDYGWLKLGMWAFLQLGGLGVKSIYGY